MLISKTKLKELVTFEIKCLSEEMQLRGNLIASGDDDQDRCEEDIDSLCAKAGFLLLKSIVIEDINNGNEWAWCCVKVTAKYGTHEGYDYLCGCSYKSEQDFKDGDYYQDMKDIALEELYDHLKECQVSLELLKGDKNAS